jgi:hypothetical protein
MAERWPPIYDAEDLKRTISKLADTGRLDASFFDVRWRDRGGPPVCQGDIVALRSSAPVIDKEGEPSIYDEGEPYRYWLVTGNSCDFDRPIRAEVFTQAVPWTQIVPVKETGDAMRREVYDALARYQTSRHFLVPTWPGSDARGTCVACFLQPVTLHKQAFDQGHVEVVARLSREGWLLLHSCLVRFLARDDGRFDEH